MKKCGRTIGQQRRALGAVNRVPNISEFTFNDRLSLDIKSAVVGVKLQRLTKHELAI